MASSCTFCLINNSGLHSNCRACYRTRFWSTRPHSQLPRTVKVRPTLCLHSHFHAHCLTLWPGAPLFGPLLRHTTLNSASPATHESALYPSPSTIYLHSHSSNAPFLPPSDQSGMTLEYWSDPKAGGRTEVWIRLDVYASLGRLVLRYRMAAVGWILGTVGVILSLQARKFRVEGADRSSFSCARDLSVDVDFLF